MWRNLGFPRAGGGSLPDRVMIIGVIAVVVVGLFWLAYRRPRPRRWLIPRRVGSPSYPGNRRLAPATTGASAVNSQHVHLQAGGLLGENAFETTKAQLQALLASGRAAEVDGALQPGLNFAVQVRACAAIGTPEAGNLLLGQLGRTLTDDPAEQAWYWVDAAAGLRQMNRGDALPAVLQSPTPRPGFSKSFCPPRRLASQTFQQSCTTSGPQPGDWRFEPWLAPRGEPGTGWPIWQA